MLDTGSFRFAPERFRCRGEGSRIGRKSWDERRWAWRTGAGGVLAAPDRRARLRALGDLVDRRRAPCCRWWPSAPASLGASVGLAALFVGIATLSEFAAAVPAGRARRADRRAPRPRGRRCAGCRGVRARARRPLAVGAGRRRVPHGPHRRRVPPGPAELPHRRRPGRPARPGDVDAGRCHPDRPVRRAAHRGTRRRAVGAAGRVRRRGRRRPAGRGPGLAHPRPRRAPRGSLGRARAGAGRAGSCARTGGCCSRWGWGCSPSGWPGPRGSSSCRCGPSTSASTPPRPRSSSPQPRSSRWSSSTRPAPSWTATGGSGSPCRSRCCSAWA